jgi:hypothetical protein
MRFYGWIPSGDWKGNATGRNPSGRPTAHTFTSKTLKVNKTLSSDSSAKVTVTIPTTGKVFQFHRDFRVGMGMQGAFYVNAGH